MRFLRSFQPDEKIFLYTHLSMLSRRQGLQNKWEEERAALNRHVFYEALKKTRDIGEQANSEDIRDELERSDSLDQLIPHLGARSQQEPFSAKPGMCGFCVFSGMGCVGFCP